MDLEGAGSVLWLSQQRLELSRPRPSFFIFRAACLTLDEQVFNRKAEKTPLFSHIAMGNPHMDIPGSLWYLRGKFGCREGSR